MQTGQGETGAVIVQFQADRLPWAGAGRDAVPEGGHQGVWMVRKPVLENRNG
ncbi:MAG: hypothetical protein AAF292_12705 [Pseudomonadota bacterium]